MGADGGTIPKRCELVRGKKKTEKVDKNVENANKWRTCQLTQEALLKPIVACKLGRFVLDSFYKVNKSVAYRTEGEGQSSGKAQKKINIFAPAAPTGTANTFSSPFYKSAFHDSNF